MSHADELGGREVALPLPGLDPGGAQIPANARRCFLWLGADPMRRIPGRCYELKHKQYRGVWCFEIGGGQRVYYMIRAESRTVLVYYAGPHPSKAPYPPE